MDSPPIRAVLGIDAAWTLSQPSGVAVMSETSTGWHLIAAEASYQRFCARANGLHPEERPKGSQPDSKELLSSSRKLCGRPVDLVAIDMPLALTPIVGRRGCDDAVSKAYGARKCGTHTPSATRPGRISDDLTGGFMEAGYPLLTGIAKPPGVIEVYPHPALVELAGAPERLRYKASKVRTYWRQATAPERRDLLYREWARIVALLEREIEGVAAALTTPGPGASGLEIKAYEDMLDAVVCAWVAVCALEDTPCRNSAVLTAAIPPLIMAAAQHGRIIMTFRLTRRHMLASVAAGGAAFSTGIYDVASAQGAKRIERLAPELDKIIGSDETINQLADGVGGDNGPAEGPVW
jgi:predicted RNase H-like nuclease